MDDCQTTLERKMDDKCSVLPKPLNLSVVIATIGRSSLLQTLECLSGWDRPPGEVIVVLPKKISYTIPPCDYTFPLRILLTSDIGQVKQRIQGFNQVMFDYVMQLDDDLFIDYQSYLELQNVLDTSFDVTASPIVVNMETNLCFYKAPVGFLGTVKDLVSSLIVGAERWPSKMGRISKAGVPYGVNRDCMQSDQLEVDWQSGGCVLHHRKNLILFDFYKFPGRATLEDLFHSFHLRSKGLRLIMCKDASTSCMMEEIRFVNTFQPLFHEFTVLSEYVKLAKLSKSRLMAWFVLSYIRIILIQCRDLLKLQLYRLRAHI